jgi:hypothetical protein
MADEFVGVFEGDGLRVELDNDDGGYEGVLELQGQSFPCQARRGGSGLVGSFESQGSSYPFEILTMGGGLALSSGGKTYNLRRAGGGGNPLAGGGDSNPLAGGGGSASGGGGSGVASSRFAGRYQGSIQGTPASMTLEQQGATVSGGIDASGYPYRLQGTVSGGKLSGQLTDPQTNGGFDFEATARGGTLDLVLLSQDPYSGQKQRVPLTFRRAGAGTQPPAGGGVPGGMGSSPGVPQGRRDPALVGVWRQSESMSGGGASMVVENFLRINQDGSFALGGGRAVGGGADWGGDTGTGGTEETGFWKTENRVVYVQGAGGGGWQPYARYYVEATKLMFTFGDNSRQIWYRVQ